MPAAPGEDLPTHDRHGIAPETDVPHGTPVPPIGEAPSRVSRLDELPDVVCARCGSSVRPWHARKLEGADSCLACVESAAIEKRNRMLLAAIGGSTLVLIVAVTLTLFGVSQRAYTTGPQQSIDRFNDAVAAGDTATASRYVDEVALRKDLAAATHTGGDARLAEVLLLEPSMKDLRLLESHATTALAAGRAAIRRDDRTVQTLDVRFLMRRESDDASGTLWVVCGVPDAQALVAQLYIIAPDLAELITGPQGGDSPALTPAPTTAKPPNAYLPTDRTSPYYNPTKDPTNPSYNPGGGPAAPAPGQPSGVPQTPPSGWN